MSARMSGAPGLKTRRGFLKTTGWVAIGVTATVAVSYPVWRKGIPALPTFEDPDPLHGIAWVQIVPGGRVRFFCPRMEMGQGATLGLSQIVAEELNVDQDQIDCVLPATDQVQPFRMTVSSESISLFFDPVSLSGARVRETLRRLAAKEFGVGTELVRDAHGGFGLPGERIVFYADLVPSEPLVDDTDEQSPPRYARTRTGQFRVIGQPWKHPELKSIVTGTAPYSQDFYIPGMVYGHVFHPPAIGANLRQIDSREAGAMPGVSVISVDKGNGFVGPVKFTALVAETPVLLATARGAVDLDWDLPEQPDQRQPDEELDVARSRKTDNFEHVLRDHGQIETGAELAKHVLTSRYDTPFAAHAAMEPRAAVAWARPGGIEVWCGTQDPFFVQKRVALLTGRDPDEVLVHPLRMGGAFGGRIRCQAAEEAALLSVETGKPVRIQWDRETEFQSNYFHPAFSHLISAGVTASGEISHWDHDFVSSPIATGPMPENVAWFMDKAMADFGTSRGSLPPYRFASHRTRYSDIRTKVPVGSWRGLGAAPNAFAIESMMDELASLAGRDPLEFRLTHLPPERATMVSVLKRVAQMSDWGTAEKPGHGKGIACAEYKDETPVAVVAGVFIDHDARVIRVTGIWCAQDCGVVVNPDQVEALVEGNIVWGCSMALKEQITFDRGRVEQVNFHTYDILRQDECPEISVQLMLSERDPAGVGEAAFGPVAPAIANAIFAATGQRVRRLPVQYDSIFPDA